jgi:Protein of unknown function (DUF1592)/Protein of unknown function (DUF1588)/Protein of unknown function (DUF1595)/Protein of unknown function (DUF1587)
LKFTETKRVGLLPLLVCVLAYGALDAGCYGRTDDDGSSGSSEASGSSGVNGPPDCNAGPGATPLRKLSTLQYQNTVRDLLSASGMASLKATVDPILEGLPADSKLAFTGLDNRISGQHINAWFDVAAAVGDQVETNAAVRTSLVGAACASATPLSPACVDGLVAGFGRRALRRPLTDKERTDLRALNDGVRPPAEALRAMVVTLLMSPAFLNQVEVDGAPVSGDPKSDLTALSPFELASRVSYTFWQTLPDDSLLDAAADGTLATDAGYKKQLDRVFADPRTKATLWQFWREWLKLDAFSGFSLGRPGFKSLTAGLPFGPGHNPYADMVSEVRELTEYVTYGIPGSAPGSLETLLSTDVSPTKSADLAAIYGLLPYSGSGPLPRFVDGRAGLLQRAALLVSSQEQTNPFHRGALMRRTFLCDALPQPDPNSLPPGSLDPPVSNPKDTTRQRYEKKVDGNQLCAGCHAQFSDLGYSLEAFDAIGRLRQKEQVFDEQTGALVAELPVDAKAVARVDLSDTRVVDGPKTLNQRMVESGKVADCVAKNYMLFTMRREATSGGDKCQQARMAEKLRSPAQLLEAFRAVAEEPAFKLKKVGAQ